MIPRDDFVSQTNLLISKKTIWSHSPVTVWLSNLLIFWENGLEIRQTRGMKMTRWQIRDDPFIFIYWCFWTVVLEKTLESPWDCKIRSVHPKGNFFPLGIDILRLTIQNSQNENVKIHFQMKSHWTDWCWRSNIWPPDVMNWLFGKDPDAGKNLGQEKGTTEDEMVGWHHRRYGHEFGWTLGDGKGQGSLLCCSPWGRKKLDMTEQHL